MSESLRLGVSLLAEAGELILLNSLVANQVEICMI